MGAVEGAICDCLLCDAVCDGPLVMSRVEAACQRAAAMKCEGDRYETAIKLLAFMREVGTMHGFVKNKDPGFHSGIMRAHPKLVSLMNRWESETMLAPMTRYLEFNELRSYYEGSRSFEVSRADELLRGTMDLKMQLETLSQELSIAESDSEEDEEDHNEISDDEEKKEEDSASPTQEPSPQEVRDEPKTKPPQSVNKKLPISAAATPINYPVKPLNRPAHQSPSRCLVLSLLLSVFLISFSFAYLSFHLGVACQTSSRSYNVNDPPSVLSLVCGTAPGDSEVRVWVDLEDGWRESMEVEEGLGWDDKKKGFWGGLWKNLRGGSDSPNLVSRIARLFRGQKG